MRRGFFAPLIFLATLSHAIAAPFLVGTWFGEGQPGDKESEMWMARMLPNGDFRAQFRSCVKGKATDLFQTGSWSLFNNIETIQIKTVDGQFYPRTDSYEILSHDAKKQTYRYLETKLDITRAGCQFIRTAVTARRQLGHTSPRVQCLYAVARSTIASTEPLAVEVASKGKSLLRSLTIATRSILVVPATPSGMPPVITTRSPAAAKPSRCAKSTARSTISSRFPPNLARHQGAMQPPYQAQPARSVVMLVRRPDDRRSGSAGATDGGGARSWPSSKMIARACSVWARLHAAAMMASAGVVASGEVRWESMMLW